MSNVIEIDGSWEYWSNDLINDVVPVHGDSGHGEHFVGDECRCNPSINKLVTHLLDRDKEWYVFSHNPFSKSVPTVSRDSFIQGLYQKNSFMNDIMAKSRKMWDDHEDMHGPMLLS